MTEPLLSREASLLICASITVLGLVVLVARFKLNAFVALVLAAFSAGLSSGMPLDQIGPAFANGMGGVLGSIAAIIGLGTILGKMLAESGGAEAIANRLIAMLGPARTQWSMMIVALVVGIPVFFAVGLVLLLPILFTVARATKTPVMWLGLPMLAGLSISHGLVPPHPGPMTAIGILKADTGKTLFYSLIIGVPVACFAGPILAGWLIRRDHREAAVVEPITPRPALTVQSAPGFGLALFTVLLPVGLMLLATFADLALNPNNPFRPWLAFAGNPIVAMLASVLFSYWSLGFARGLRREQILKFSEDSLAPVASVLLVVGAGGGFSRVLIECGVGRAIAGMAQNVPISPLILGWLAAALIRVATGSATVAISTAAGLLAPVALNSPNLNLELLVLAMGAGSLILSHLNDGGFWLVKEYFNLTVAETLRTWTVMETAISIVALALILLLDAVL